METTTTTQSLELFITALVGQNYSPKTLRAYGDDLRQFMQWVGENRVDWDNPRRFTRADVEGFMSYLAGQHMTGVTRVRKLAAIRKLFTFMEENRIIAGNPANTVKGARREEKEPGILYKEQYKALLYEASDTPARLRHHHDVFADRHPVKRARKPSRLRMWILRIKSSPSGKAKARKTGKFPSLMRRSKRFAIISGSGNTQLVLDDEIFFLAKNGTSLNVSTVKYTVAKYVKKAGIRKRVGVHTLRHTFGAHKADKNMGIAALQQVMGHKKKETTLKYIHLAKTNLRQEMSQTAL